MKTARELIDEVVHGITEERSINKSDLKRYQNALKKAATELGKTQVPAEICEKAVQVLWDLDSILEQINYDEDFVSSVGHTGQLSKHMMTAAELFKNCAKQARASR